MSALIIKSNWKGSSKAVKRMGSPYSGAHDGGWQAGRVSGRR
ncbi:hypothetical protein CKO_04094 [Citrobacter koseri ATCC BAA-895]|uniref:Uncharacterized protein n=1 Tax=Citrobacter koseri (strain ATCC BAA-895 / CDC 4225-83 / SGSC4696) TaxID=290338 RepID=A8ANU6_CITK8|nr:hypothetical protein CKO_04094 [Citrobacter koseri ATCC BAA-895]